MKDRLEEFVRGHNQEFDMFEPGDALWEGIEKRLDKQEKKGRGVVFYISRAAAVAAIFVLSFGVHKYMAGSNGTEIPELQEAEMYYSGMIEHKLEEAKPMFTNYPSLEEEINTDLEELDSIYKSLKEDLKDNISNQEVIEAMIDNYRMRVQILEEILGFLDKQSDEPNNTSEYEL